MVTRASESAKSTSPPPLVAASALAVWLVVERMVTSPSASSLAPSLMLVRPMVRTMASASESPTETMPPPRLEEMAETLAAEKAG